MIERYYDGSLWVARKTIIFENSEKQNLPALGSLWKQDPFIETKQALGNIYDLLVCGELRKGLVFVTDPPILAQIKETVSAAKKYKASPNALRICFLRDIFAKLTNNDLIEVTWRIPPSGEPQLSKAQLAPLELSDVVWVFLGAALLPAISDLYNGSLEKTLALLQIVHQEECPLQDSNIYETHTSAKNIANILNKVSFDIVSFLQDFHPVPPFIKSIQDEESDEAVI